MKINTADFAYWTIEEYIREDGTKPELKPDAVYRVRLLCSAVDTLTAGDGEMEVVTDILKETESLIIDFRNGDILKGHLELGELFEK